MHTQTHAYNKITRTNIHTYNTQILTQIHTFKHTYTHVIIDKHIHMRAYFLVFKNT